MAAFGIRSVPRLIGTGDTPGHADVAGQLGALWTVLNETVNSQGATVELRIEALESDASLSVSLRMHGELSQSMNARIRQVQQLLPSGYRWAFEKPCDRPPHERRIARVVRNLGFVDLPITPKRFLKDFEVGRKSEQYDERLGEYLAAWGMARREGQRFHRMIPTLETRAKDLERHLFCLPFAGGPEIAKLRTRWFYEKLIDARPVTVSICMHPVSAAQLNNAQFVTLRWLPFLEMLQQIGHDRGVGQFLLPRDYLVGMSFRVAAEQDHRAIATANLLASTMGGAKKFHVHAPKRDAEPGSLTRPDADMPGPTWTPEYREGFVNPMWDRLVDESIGFHLNEDVVPSAGERSHHPGQEDILDLMLLLPHVYSVQEASGMLTLPSSDEEGLPGIDSRFLPPFAAPHLHLSPVHKDGKTSEPPRGKVRIGMSGTGMQAQAGWHSVYLKDLTKHALVVGSTGSGKTVTTTFIARDVSRSGVPIMIIEPVKTEYFGRLKKRMPNIVRRCFSGRVEEPWRDPAHDEPENGWSENDASYWQHPEFLAFDPMRVPERITVGRHASYLKSCFEAAFPMEPVLALMLENAILEYYTGEPPLGCGYDLFTEGGEWLLRTENKAAMNLVMAAREKSDQAPVGSTQYEAEAVAPKQDAWEPKEFYEVSDSQPEAARGATEDPEAVAEGGQPSGDGIVHDRVFPSFQTFCEYLFEVYLPNEFSSDPDNQSIANNFKEMFRRRIQNLGRSVLGRCFMQADRIALQKGKKGYDDLGHFFDVDTVVELDSLPDQNHKSLVMAFLLTRLLERRQAEALESQDKPSRDEDKLPLKHLLIVEEAHRILSSDGASGRGDMVGQDAKAKAVSLFVDMLAEIRAYGQGLMIVEQIPSKIASEAVKNTNLKIMLRTTSKVDRDYLGEAMNFTEAQKRFVTNLKASEDEGVNFVVFDESVDLPIMLNLPWPGGDGKPEGYLYDEFFEVSDEQ